MVTKSEVEDLIRDWYDSHPNQYSLTVEGEEAKPTIEGYNPEQRKEKDNLVRVRWKGMTITLAFEKPLVNIEWTRDGLQSNFAYVVLDDIPHEISVDGWKIAPKTPQSSKREGVTFHEVSESRLRFRIDWSIFAVSGYSRSQRCQDEMRIADKSMPEDCCVNVRKTLPLHVEVNVSKP